MRELYKNEVLCPHCFDAELCKRIDEYVSAGDLQYENTLFSRPEQDYLNYMLNKSEFSNGLDLRNKYTGKGIAYGGSLIRPEATGYGAVYYAAEMLKSFGESIEGKTFAVSGFGNVAWGTVKKITELGGKVLTISGPDGYVYDPDGISTDEKIDYMLEMRNSGRDKVQDYADKFGVQFFAGKRPWEQKVDVVMPCATQNEVGEADAKNIVANGVKYYVEVANMPTTEEAMAIIKASGAVIAPSKAVNAGGVAVSGLEMSQNSMRYSWTAEEVDAKLKQIMADIFKNSYEAAKKYGMDGDLVAGANIAGFEKVADAMIAQGIAY